MFKKLLLVVLCLIAASFCYAQASDQAGDKQQPDQPQVSDQPKTDEPMATDQTTAPDQSNKMLNGTISIIDHEKMEITVKDDTTKDKQKFTFTTETALTKDGAAITHNDLKKGDHINVEINAQNSATKIDVTPKESTKKDEKKDSSQPH